MQRHQHSQGVSKFTMIQTERVTKLKTTKEIGINEVANWLDTGHQIPLSMRMDVS